MSAKNTTSVSISLERLLTEDRYAREHIDTFCLRRGLLENYDSLFYYFGGTSFYTRSGVIKDLLGLYLGNFLRDKNRRTFCNSYFGMQTALDYNSPRHQAACKMGVSHQYNIMSNTLHCLSPRTIAFMLLSTRLNSCAKDFRRYCGITDNKTIVFGFSTDQILEILGKV